MFYTYLINVSRSTKYPKKYDINLICISVPCRNIIYMIIYILLNNKYGEGIHTFRIIISAEEFL